MKVIKKIFLCIVILLINLSVNVYASYNYTYKFKAFSLTRDDTPIAYNIIKSVEDGVYTNNDVSLSINFNKTIDKIEGFDISEDGKVLTKTLKENESQTIVVEDISGNRCKIPYNINNIDKIPPEIIGIENGGTYKLPQNINYKDNVGVKSIYVDKYSVLKWDFYNDYYDTYYYKGTNLTNSTISVNLTSHPKNTSYYKYYLNENLKAQTKENKFKLTGLNAGTTYQVKVEALDSNNQVIQSVTKQVKTKYYKDIHAEKQENTFKVTLYGIDSKVQSVTPVAYTTPSNAKYYNATINSDRSLTFTFSALDVTSSLINDYYYFHIQFWNNEKILDTVCCNVIFNTTYVEKDETIDPYNLIDAGNYQIIVTDLAGNITTKDITITQ